MKYTVCRLMLGRNYFKKISGWSKKGKVKVRNCPVMFHSSLIKEGGNVGDALYLENQDLPEEAAGISYACSYIGFLGLGNFHSHVTLGEDEFDADFWRLFHVPFVKITVEGDNYQELKKRAKRMARNYLA